eukprot:Phypoly_transcript_06860.p3 GENE.Phypoly_transcript_06860~~Phypoly_transcript_06860.p3  ORF type:complete len:235 (+),score=41.51 Phypoly_transcript_06860:832-1536(+)
MEPITETTTEPTKESTITEPTTEPPQATTTESTTEQTTKPTKPIKQLTARTEPTTEPTTSTKQPTKEQTKPLKESQKGTQVEHKKSQLTREQMESELKHLTKTMQSLTDRILQFMDQSASKGQTTGPEKEKRPEEKKFEFVINGISYIIETQHLPEVGHKARLLVDILGVPFDPTIWKALLAANVMSQNDFVINQMTMPGSYADEDTKYILMKRGNTSRQFWANYVKSLSKKLT